MEKVNSFTEKVEKQNNNKKTETKAEVKPEIKQETKEKKVKVFNYSNRNFVFSHCTITPQSQGEITEKEFNSVKFFGGLQLLK